jgi:hypothetical protein
MILDQAKNYSGTKYYVVSRIYDSMKVKSTILLESEYAGQKTENCATYDQYVDVFTSYQKAERFHKDNLGIK